jgi:hypothetical protein
MSILTDLAAQIKLQEDVNKLLQQQSDIEKEKLSTAEKLAAKLQENKGRRSEILSQIKSEKEALDELISRTGSLTAAEERKVRALEANLAARKLELDTLNETIAAEEKAQKRREAGKKIIDDIKQKVVSLFNDVRAELDKINGLNAKLVADTGATFQTGIASGVRAVGMGVEQLNNAYAGLYSEMATFSDLSARQQKDLAVTASNLSRVGVSVELTAKNFNVLTKSIGLTAGAAAQTQERLARTAMGLGVAPKKMLADFNSAMNQLGVYGRNGVVIFEKLARQAKAMGVEVSTLNDIFGENMDTFEGASEIAGNLNAQFGTNLFTVEELLGADEAQRASLVKTKLQMMGISSETEKFNKKMLMNTLHMKDANVFNSYFNTTMEESNKQMDKKAVAEERYYQILQKTVPFAEQLALMFQEFALIFQPIYNELMQLTIGFRKWLLEAAKAHPILTLLGGVFVAIIISAVPFITFLYTLGAALGFVSAPAATAGVSLSTLVPVILATTAAVFVIGLAIAGVVLAMGYLIGKFEGLKGLGVETAKAFFLIAAGIAAVMFAASNPLGLLGIAAIGGLLLVLDKMGVLQNLGITKPKEEKKIEAESPKTTDALAVQSKIEEHTRNSLAELKKIREAITSMNSKEQKIIIKIDEKIIGETAVKAYNGQAIVSFA